jgi:hypothetical protein
MKLTQYQMLACQRGSSVAFVGSVSAIDFIVFRGGGLFTVFQINESGLSHWNDFVNAKLSHDYNEMKEYCREHIEEQMLLEAEA